MNSLILENFSGIVSDPKILKHLHGTLKAKVGDFLKCTVLGEGLCRSEILDLSADRCLLKLGAVRAAQKPWFNLIVGLSRPQTLKKILEHSTTFGAAQIHFFKAALSEKSYMDSNIFNTDELNDYLKAGLSQSGIYAQVPIVKVDKYNPAQSYENLPQKFILDLNASENFLDLKSELDFSRPVTLAFGPERGFIPEDIERFQSAGFKSVKVSSSILRVEHAVYSAVSQLELIKGQF